MAKKITVGEIAKRAESGLQGPAKRELDIKKILFALGIGLGLAFAVICAWQAWAALSAEWAKNGAQRLASDLGQTTTEEIKQYKAHLERAASSQEMLEQMTMVEGFDPAAAQARVRKLIPEASDADVIRGADVNAALGGRFAEFGFAKTDVLLEAQEENSTVQAQMHVEKDESYSLVLASPVKRGESTYGFILAKFPAQKIISRIQSFDSAGGIALQQKGLNDPVTMISAGNGPAGSGAVDVPGSRLQFAYGTAEAFTPLPFEGWLLPLILSLLGLGFSALLVFLRNKPELFADIRSKVTPKPAEEKPAAARIPTQAEKSVADSAAAKIAAIKEREKPIETPPPLSSISRASGSSVSVDASIFRAYDIRGVVGKTLNEATAELLGRALGSEVVERGMNEMVVGRDGRLSGPSLSAALIRGLQASGCNVIDLGLVPTPVLYFATHQLKTGCGVIVTGSHNPPDYNGFKMMIGGTTLAEQSIKDLYARIQGQRFAEGRGQLQTMDVSEDYIDIISGDIQLESPLRVVVDAGNGVPGAIAPKLLQAIGCEVESLYCEVDGNFPNHHPDPSDPKNLKDLIVAVKQMNADIGVAFDGDGDRLGVVTRAGKIIYPDRLLILFARDVLTRVPGASIIYDVKCTSALAHAIRAAGGVPVMYKTGHSLIKGKMKELDAALAGEMSGHFFFKERWFGFDDGLYAACRLLEILSSSGVDADDLFDELPDAVSTPELKVEMREGEHYAFMQRFQASAQFAGARLTTIDGIRADFDEGWGLVRCSNTTPCLVLRFEAQNDAALKSVQQKFRAQLLAVDPSLKLPF
jgi:phosphomannomutase / phosphoglucomutase